ncbi:MAG: hypothetical protein GY766_13120, partial [Herbaspirillum sp.]|uniref:hypothetical protein n=1 Tax=Herbaspirillum sp. TaxID=1890675 RepID=UPI002585BF8A
MNEHVFTVSTNAVAEDEELRKSKQFEFGDLADFKLPIHSLTLDEMAVIYVYGKLRRSDFKFVRIAAVQCHFPFRGRYILTQPQTVCIEDRVPLHRFADKYGAGGSLQIFSSSEIVISENAEIIGSGRGLTASSKHSNRGCLKFGGLSESKEVEAERESVEGAGGGVIALISGDGVTNNGSVECRASDSAHFSGGTIMISTDGRFQNNGVIDCGPGGVVLIDCAEFVDKGAITPSPMVVVRTEKAAMPWIQSMTSKLTEQRMKLKVESHRGHHVGYFGDSYPPENLLKEGSGARYMSVAGKPVNGDWIVFEHEADSRFIPKMVVIRNYWNWSAIKKIAICGGNKR